MAMALPSASLAHLLAGVPPDVQFEMDFLAQVGIDLQLELVDAPTFNQRRNSGEFELAGRGISCDQPRHWVLFAYLHPDNKAPAGLNGARYDNPELTALLEAARSETDSETRMELYCEVQRIANDRSALSARARLECVLAKRPKCHRGDSQHAVAGQLLRSRYRIKEHPGHAGI